MCTTFEDKTDLTVTEKEKKELEKIKKEKLEEEEVYDDFDIDWEV